MSKTINQADQYSNKGSGESRLRPRMSTDTVRANGPRMGSEAGVRATTGGRTLMADGDMARRRRIGLPERFLKG